MLVALRGSTKVQKYGATVICSSCICCTRYLHAYVEDVEPLPRKSRAYLREPPGFVAAHRWMLHRPANDNLQNLIFHGEQKDREPGVEGNFLSSAVRAHLSGSPVKDDFTYPIIDTVADVPLVDRRLYENLSRMGFDQLTPVQRHAIGLLCTEDVTEIPGGEASYQRVTGSYDLMAAAQTGSGKTLAYLIPMVNRLLRVYPYEAMQSLLGQPSCQFPSGLILAPTRELVQQILSEVTKLSYRTFLRPVGIYGGERPVRQLHQISLGCHVAVATPGRLLDFLRQGKLLLSHCRSLVLDEADRMLDMGFEEQIREILESPEHCMPKPQQSERQTCLFSATFPREVSLLARNFLRGSRCISLTLGGQDTGVVVPEWGKSTSRGTDLSSLTRIVPREIKQRIEFVPSSSVQNLHTHLLDLVRRLISGGEQSAEEGALNQVLIFCNTKREVDEVDARLYQNGVKSASIHGDKSQPHRSRALELFRRGTVQVLVASSVAARGLDIPHVTAVINVGFPVEIDDYVHRIGRTGRMGRAGEAITVLNQTLLDRSSRSVARGVLRVLQSSMGNTETNIPEPVLSFACLNPGDFDEEPRYAARRSSQSNRYSPPRSNRNSGFGDKKRSFESLDELSRRYT
ncbi:ATP-dependent RNA helicase ded1 [Clonorchis sinensis]|uniref:RNA helicase n=1 Tax=Clonorchis sinensis TaxID=79923 RepID=A0A8T1MMH2_CLOSI|nr:ATP-dependent RNA helicase ded1 [Clonorchis sinensis]